jgi:hypothetical protein
VKGGQWLRDEIRLVVKKREGPSALRFSEGIKRRRVKGGQWPRYEIRFSRGGTRS